MKKLITFSFVFILCSNIVITSQETSAINQSENISEVESQEPMKNFEDLYLQQKDFNEKILNTVYWALGSILFVLLAIVGSNLYYNFRFNKKNYDDLLEEHRKKFDELKVTLFNKIINELDIVFKDFTEKNIAFKKEIDEQLKQDRKELGNDYKDRLNSFSENLKEQISTLKNNIGEFNKSNEKAIKTIDDKIFRLIDTTKGSLNDEINLLRSDIYGLEAEMWISKKMYPNALMLFLQQAFVCIEIKQFFKLEFTLNHILDVILKSDSLAEWNEKSIEKLLSEIPEKFSDLKVKISEETTKLKSREKE